MPPKRRLSETSDGQESLGAEEEAGTSAGAEEEERVKAGPGRPKKKKVDPSQQLQVILKSCVQCPYTQSHGFVVGV